MEEDGILGIFSIFTKEDLEVLKYIIELPVYKKLMVREIDINHLITGNYEYFVMELSKEGIDGSVSNKYSLYFTVSSSSDILKEWVEDKSIQIEPSELKDELIRINPLIPEK